VTDLERRVAALEAENAKLQDHTWRLKCAGCEPAQARIEKLEEALRVVLPIVEEAFYDHRSAGMLPGSGYSHRVYARVSEVFGWRDTKKFDEWKAALKGKS
jgi:hypothetical protein